MVRCRFGFDPTNGRPSPGTLLATTRVPGPNYPVGGVPRPSPTVYVDFPFPNILVPDLFTFTMINLDHNGNPDVTYGVDPITRAVADSAGS